jgi:hypothetical protein
MESPGPPGWEAQIHRESYIAILKGRLRKPGAKKAFAAEIGISPQYLSYLLDPFDHRAPSAPTAQAIAGALALTDHERFHMLDHLLRAGNHPPDALPFVAHGHAPSERHGWLTAPDAVEAWAAQIRQMHAQSLFTHDPHLARIHTTATAQSARHFLDTVNMWQQPLAYAEIALVLHEINCQRNQLSRAIYFAKRARMVLSHADRAKLHPLHSRAMNALTNALRCEAVAYNNLKLYKVALHLLDQAEASPGAQAAPEIWLPHLYRDRLNAVAGIRRVALGEAERVAREGARWAKIGDSTHAEMFTLLLQKGLALVYLRHGRTAHAEPLLLQLMEQMNGNPQAGPMYQAMVRLDYAELLWRTQRHEEWREVMPNTIRLAADAELTLTLTRIHKRYGRAVQPFLADLDQTLTSTLAENKAQFA